MKFRDRDRIPKVAKGRTLSKLSTMGKGEGLYIFTRLQNLLFELSWRGLNKARVREGFQKKLQTWAFGSTSADTYLPSELGPP